MSFLRSDPAYLRTLLACCVLAACGDDDDAAADHESGGRGGAAGAAGRSQAGAGDKAGAGASGGQGGAGSELQPVYLTVVRTWGQDSAFQYARVSHEVRPGFSRDDYETAREFGGYSGFTIQDGHILVGDAEAPFVHKYRITEDLAWEEVGEPLNLGDYFEAGEDGLNDFFQAKRGNDQFFFYGAGRTSRVHWQVDEWAFAGAYTDTQLPVKEGWDLFNAGNRGRLREFDDAIVWPFLFAPDEDMGVTGNAESYLAVYDGTSFEEKQVITPGCSFVSQASKDEQGNLYYTSVEPEDVLKQLYGEAAPSCVVKLKPDGTLDESFGPKGERKFEDLTDLQLPGTVFRYLGKGKGVLGLLDVSRVENATFEGDIPDEVFCQVLNCADYNEDEDNPRFSADLVDDYRKDLWSMYVVDVETKKTTKVTGYANPEEALGWPDRWFSEVDGHFYFEVGTRWGEDPKLSWYELNLETAEATLVEGSLVEVQEGKAEFEPTVLARVR